MNNSLSIGTCNELKWAEIGCIKICQTEAYLICFKETTHTWHFTESECSDSDEDTTKETSKANMDFDFDVDDDLNSTPTLAASRKALPGSAQRELKGSARKRTTDYKSILSNLDRQRKQDEAGKAAAAASTPNKNWKKMLR